MRAFLILLKVLNKIPIFYLKSVKRKKNWKRPVSRICLFACFASAQLDMAFSETLQRSEIIVKGQIRLSSGELPQADGLNVVLLKLILNAEGHVTPLGPQGRVITDSNGNFEFLKINPDYRAGYQVGTRVDGKLYSSKVFFLKAGEKQVEKDIIVPGITTYLNKLDINQVLLVIESGISSVSVTEVLSFYNSSPDRIDTRDNSVEQALPKGLNNFKMIQSSSGEEIQHKIDDHILNINHVFPPGNTQIIFHYNMGAWYGSLSIFREFNHSLDKVSVLTPSGQLQIKSPQMIFSGEQQMLETDFLVWKAKASDSNQLEFKISNVPVDSLEYIGIAAVILLILFLSAIIFYRNRLMMRDLN